MAVSGRGKTKWKVWLWRAAIEVTGIIFLFYSNLLMGEFNRSSGKGKTLQSALHNIVTGKNFAIAVLTAGLGFVVFEFFRKKLETAERRNEV